MWQRFVPKEARFFDLFAAAASHSAQAAVAFRAMLDDLGAVESHAQKIKALEHQADAVTRQVIEVLHKNFITPIDRSYIHMLASRQDDILDYIDSAAERVYLYELKTAPPPCLALADLAVEGTALIQEAVGLLENLSNAERIMATCAKVGKMETAADQVLRQAVARLFHDEEDLRLVIKLKEIFEIQESVTDRCEDVADAIESIVLEHA